MGQRGLFLGRLAGVTQILFAVLLGGVASFRFEPGFVPRGTVLLVMFSLPGVVGLIGATARRPALVLAAGLASLVGSFLAFSGVTLIFLVPSLLFFLSAGFAGLASRPADASAWLGGVARLAIAPVIAVLLLGAGASTLLITDSGCWAVSHTTTGVHIETMPFSQGEMTVSAAGDSVGCATGLISARGTGLGALLGTLAVALSLVVARRRLSDEGPRAGGAPVA